MEARRRAGVDCVGGLWGRAAVEDVHGREIGLRCFAGRWAAVVVARRVPVDGGFGRGVLGKGRAVASDGAIGEAGGGRGAALWMWTRCGHAHWDCASADAGGGRWWEGERAQGAQGRRGRGAWWHCSLRKEFGYGDQVVARC